MIKSQFNLQKTNSDPFSSLTYIKSLPSHIVKKQYFITPSKIDKNLITSTVTPETKTEKNEDSLSTFPLTKENMIITPQKSKVIDKNEEEKKNNLRSLSCCQRSLKKNGKIKEGMIFVKKKIQGNLKNSFMLNKTESDIQENNSCCYYGESPQQLIKLNPNNSMDYGCNNYYNRNYMNALIKNLDNNNGGSKVLITNNNINLITNNNYINSNNEDYPNNNEKIVVRNNSSAVRKKKKINKIRVVQNVQSTNYNKNQKNQNIISYFNQMNINIVNSPSNFNFIAKDVKIYNPKKEKVNKIKKRNINYNIMSNSMNMNTNHLNPLSPKMNNNILLKEINFEDFYLLMQKFEIIKNNIILLGNLSHCSNKQLLENINMSRIFIYDLYKFYLGCSIEGCPQNLYNEKNSKLNLHFYSITLVLSLGLMYVITHKIKMTKDYQGKLLGLINIQQRAFLIFCDAMINKINNSNNNNMKDIWLNEIFRELNNKKILNTTNHISQIKTLSNDSYKMFNDIINNIYISNNDKCIPKKNEQENFLFRHFHNKTISYLSTIKIHDLEEIFDKNIFQIINLRSNFANITSLKSNNNSQSNNHKPQNKNSTSFIFRNENINNKTNFNKYEFSIKPLLFLNKKI